MCDAEVGWLIPWMWRIGGWFLLLLYLRCLAWSSFSSISKSRRSLSTARNTNWRYIYYYFIKIASNFTDSNIILQQTIDDLRVNTRINCRCQPVPLSGSWTTDWIQMELERTHQSSIPRRRLVTPPSECRWIAVLACKMDLLTLWPWPLTFFNPKSISLRVYPYTMFETLGVIRFWGMLRTNRQTNRQTNKQTDSLVITVMNYTEIQWNMKENKAVTCKF